MKRRDAPHAPPVITQWIGRLSGIGAALAAAEPFVLAGIAWEAPADARIELRARQPGGAWTPWLTASTLGHDSDGGETIAHALVGEPVWTGPADALQLRSSGVVEGLSVQLVRAAAVSATPSPSASRPTGGRAIATTAEGLPLATPQLPAGPGQPPIIARGAWAHGLLPRHPPIYGDVQLAFVHHSVNANGYGPEQVPEILRSIYLFHTYSRGWNDFGYNFAVDAYGRVWEGRAGGIDRPVIGAQAGGYNAESFGVVLLGDFAATLPTAAAQRALAHLIAWKLALHGVPVEGRVTVEVDPSDAYYTRYRPGQRVSLPRIAAHREGCTTDCPGYDMYVSGMPPLRRTVASIVGRQHALTLTPGPPHGAAYALAPYAIAHGTRIERASLLRLQAIRIPVAEQLPLHGFLRSLGGEPVRDAKISLQTLDATRQEDPQTEVAVAVTRHDGLWAVTLEAESNLLLRALHADGPAAVSPLVLIGVVPQVTLTITPTGARLQLLQVDGTVYPDKRHVLLEVRPASGKRHPARRISLETAAGSFATTLRLAPGRYWITATTAADAATLAGSSPPVSVEV